MKHMRRCALDRRDLILINYESPIAWFYEHNTQKLFIQYQIF